MIPGAYHPAVRLMWPHVRAEAQAAGIIEPRLLLALYWVHCSLAPCVHADGGLRDLLTLAPRTAFLLARQQRGDACPVRRLAVKLAEGLRSGCLRPALAAVFRSASPLDPGPDVPEDPRVCEVLDVWRWLRRHLEAVLGTAGDRHARAIRVLEPAPWQLCAATEPPLTRPLEDADVPLLEALAAHQRLVFWRDDARRMLHLGPQVPAPPRRRGLVAPVAHTGPVYEREDGLLIPLTFGSPVAAAGAGTVHLSLPNIHCTPSERHTPGLVILALDRPLCRRGQWYRFAWYSGLSHVRFYAEPEWRNGPRVKAGEILGWSGRDLEGAERLRFVLFSDRRGPGPLAPAVLAARFGWRLQRTGVPS